MYRFSDHVNQNVQEEEASREAVSRKHEVELEIQVLEERIAPGIGTSPGRYGLNRSETMCGERSMAEEVELDIQVLEERIAPKGVITPFASVNRSETMSGERATAEEVELDIQVLEERIAPGVRLNRSETMCGERATAEEVELDIQILEERIAPKGVVLGS
jgi:hypothetical protein